MGGLMRSWKEAHAEKTWEDQSDDGGDAGRDHEIWEKTVIREVDPGWPRVARMLFPVMMLGEC